jgi:predicted ATP-dependent Lon-type protease
MKRYALLAALAVFLGNAAQAAVIELVPGNGVQTNPVPQAVPDTAVTGHTHIVTPPSHLPELPEPEVFAMMLVGLILIGYRAGRDSSDKFK